MKSMNKYIAEFIGTFVLVLFACGTAVMVGCKSSPGSGYLITALTFGLVIVAMAYSIGNISGCHINPAVSLAMMVNGKLSIKDFFGYVIAQVAGAFFATGVMLIIMGKEVGFGANSLYNGDVIKSLIIEFILTFVFVITILGVTSKKEYSSVAGLVIGLSLTLVHLLGISFTGTSVNPARSLAPAVLTGGEALSCVWVFIVGPFVGALMAALVYQVLSEKEETKTEDAAETVAEQ